MSSKNLRDQLGPVKQAVLKTNVPANPGSWLKDAVDHINISRYSESPVGRALNLDNVRHWNHPVLGPFRSLNTLWFFLKAKYKTDAIRSLSGHELKNFVAKRCGGQVGRVPNFRAIILHSAYLRLKACPDILAEFVKSTLPFDCYRTMESGVRVRFEHSMWFAGGHEEIRAALKENREPNFNHLIDSVGELYDGVLKELAPVADPAALKAASAALEKTEVNKKSKKKPQPQAAAVPDVSNIASKIKDIDAGSHLTVSPAVVEVEVAPVVEVLDAAAEGLPVPEAEVDPVDQEAAADETFALVEPEPAVVVPEDAEVKVQVEEAAPTNALQAALMSSGLAVEPEATANAASVETAEEPTPVVKEQVPEAQVENNDGEAGYVAPAAAGRYAVGEDEVTA